MGNGNTKIAEIFIQGKKDSAISTILFTLYLHQNGYKRDEHTSILGITKYKEIGVEKMMTKMPNVFQVKINLL